MCGIAGFINLSRAALGGHEDVLIRRMMASLEHRGPDDGGAWSSPDRMVTLGHRRLSILDLSPNGHQPMIGASGSVLVYNGELYNYARSSDPSPCAQLQTPKFSCAVLKPTENRAWST